MSEYRSALLAFALAGAACALAVANEPLLAQDDTAERLRALERQVAELPTRNDLENNLERAMERIDLRIAQLEVRLILTGLAVAGLFAGAGYFRRRKGR